MKKILVVLLVVLMVLPLSVIPAGAKATGSGYLTAFEARTALDDLLDATFDGKPFSTSMYPYVPGSNIMQILSFVEYGYSNLSSSDERYNDYSLFLYVYNPGNLNVSTRDLRHAISMKIGGDTEYAKYSMQLLSASGEGSNNQLYLKFRVNISASVLREKIDGAEIREYSISEFEIVTAGDNNATTHEGGAWSFTGYSEGYGKSGSPELTVSSGELNGTVLIKDIGQGVWRTAADNTGWNYVQIDSVYFTIPHEVTDRYGDKLVDILYELYAYNTGWMVGFEHDKPYNLFKDKGGEVLSKPDDNLPVLVASKDGATALGDYFYWVYNNRVDSLGTPHVSNCLNEANMLSYVFKYAEGADSGDIVDTDVREYLSEQWKLYNRHEVSAFDYLPVSLALWEGYGPVTPYRRIHSSDLDYKLNSFDGNWWEKLWNCKSAYNEFEVEPIQTVDDNNIRNIEGELYLDNRYADDVKAMYTEAKKRGDTMYVFHFAASDYNSYQVFCSSLIGDKKEIQVTGDDEGGFVCRENVFMDFDMLQMTFERNGIQTVLPVQMSPINVIGELQLPDDYNPPDGVPKWVIILIAILILVVVVILCPALLPILVRIVILPIKLLWWFIKALGRGISGLIRNIKDRKK